MYPAFAAKNPGIGKQLSCFWEAIRVEFPFGIPSVVADNIDGIDLIAGVLFDKIPRL
jgi:hypothetical protein